MRSSLTIVCVTASVASIAGLGAAYLDKMKHRLASSLAIAAGFAPWLFLVGWHYQSNVPTLVGMFGSGPLFVVSAISYLMGKGNPSSQKVGTCIIGGIIAGVVASVSILDLLSQME